jgi:hypothetical protein
MRPSDRITLFIRNVVLHIAFNGDYVWPAEPTPITQNRRGIAAERLGCTGKIIDARRSRQVLEVADFHGLDALTSARGTPSHTVAEPRVPSSNILRQPLEAIGVNCEDTAGSHPPLTPAGFARSASRGIAIELSQPYPARTRYRTHFATIARQEDFT